jgi:hypothetical protein
MSRTPVDPDQVLDGILERLRQQHVPPMPDSLITPVIKPARREQSSRFPQELRISTMQRRVTISAALLAFSAVVLVLAFGPFARGRLFAFSDVQKAIATTKSMTYDCLLYDGNDDPVVHKVMCLGGDRVRREKSGGVVQIVNRKDGVMMTISHVNRTAVITSMYPQSPELSKMSADWFARFRTLPEKASRRIGEREAGGRKVVDFLVKLDEQDFTVTVDSQTKLPVRMEFATERLAATGRSFRVLLSGFVFDAPLDESLFAMIPPTGYKVERQPLPKNPSPPVDDRDLVLSPETGIGAAHFGMNQEEVVRALGQPDSSSTSESTMEPQTETGLYSKPQTYVNATLDYASRGFSLQVSSGFRIAGATYAGYGLLTIRAFGQAAIGLPTVRDFQGKTSKGIRLGATPEDVIRAYGKPIARSDSESFTALTYTPLGWSFEFRHGKLSAINLNYPFPADTLKAAKSPKHGSSK